MNLTKTILSGLAVAFLNAPLAFTQAATPSKLNQSVKAASTAAAVKHQSEVVEYKDGEDMTTRYRPGNNKTTSAAPAVTPASVDQTKKHLAGVKYQDRSAAPPACVAAATDAATCTPPPSTSHGATKVVVPKAKP